MIECVPNFSEGRDPDRIAALERSIASVPGIQILHLTSDADHHRTVITFAGSAEAVGEAALRASAKAAELIDLNNHRGVHPRVGALDVLPFVPLDSSSMTECVDLAHRVGELIWNDLGIPVYFYEAAARQPGRERLETVRHGQFEGLREQVLLDQSRRPDVGGPGLHPTAGAIIVGARKVLIAYNINLQSNDLGLAQSIARRIRSSSGGLPAVKAIGLRLQSRGLVQVSMNLTDYERTPLHVVYKEVERLAAEQSTAVFESELIGLIPRKALEDSAAAFLKLNDFDSGRVIENKLDRLSRDLATKRV